MTLDTATGVGYCSNMCSNNEVAESVAGSADDCATTLLTRLEGALDALLALPAHQLSDAAVLAVADGTETVRRRLPAMEHRVIVELECRGVAAQHLQRNTTSLLAARLHLDPAAARARVRAAQLLGPRTGLTGDPLPPLLAATAAAQAVGAISEAHAAIIARTVHALPHTLEPDVAAQAESYLAREATHVNPTELTRHAELLATYLDPDGTLTDDTDRDRRRGLTLGTQGSDGMSPIRGLLDPTCRALLDAAISALARPSATHDATEPTPVRVPDPRTPEHRRHDALAALCRAALAGGRLPGNRGLPAGVVITMTLAQLEAAMAAAAASADPAATGDAARTTARASNPWANPDGATATTATGTRLPLPDALALAADARWSLALFDHRGQPLFLGRDNRLATAAQRLALTARDRGCTRPGCDLPPGYTQVHHLDEWAQGGNTDVDRMCLVCDYDHRLITHEGFTVTMGPDGRVQWTAPAHLDPSRTPHVNPLHHPPDLTDPDPPRLAA